MSEKTLNLSDLKIMPKLIVAFLAMGMTRKECAATLKLSVKTVDFYINNPDNPNSVQRVLGYYDPARLTHYALLTGLVELGIVI